MKIEDNKLIIGELAASHVVNKYGTPLYVYDALTIRKRYSELIENIPYKPLRINYACKANTNFSILRLLLDEGCCIDAVSQGEVHAALVAGFNPEQILFTGNNVTDEEMKFAIERKVLVNIDSLHQLERYGKLNPGSEISVRINPDIGAGHHSHTITGGEKSKFGIDVEKIVLIKAIAQSHNLKIVGIHQHIGSQILEAEKLLVGMTFLLKAAKQFKDLRFVNFGGGIGIPYKPTEKRIDMKDFGSKVSIMFEKFCSEYGKKLELWLEPGRYLVAESGALLAEVNTIKQSKHKFIGVNTGFNHLMRPTMYGSYHEILKVDEVNGNKESVAIAGNICEAGDVFTRDEGGIVEREITQLKQGDIIAIMDAGAYGYSMASSYNMRGRPAEVLVDGAESMLIRKREDFEDLIMGMR